MPLPLTDEHEELRRTASRLLASFGGPAAARVLVDAEVEELQPVWSAMAGEGWLGLHLGEDRGGQGFGLLELAVILEETGWSVTPGPLLPTAAVSALCSRYLPADEADRVLTGLADGSVPAAVHLGAGTLDAVRDGVDGPLVVSGALRPVLGLGTAGVALVPARTADGATIWCLLDLDDERVRASPLPSLDATRRVGLLEVDGTEVLLARQLRDVPARRVDDVALALLAAEHAGGARWCLETATEYAKVRVQFGRPIGQFQAVKHRAADMAVLVEQLASVAWDAVLAVDAALRVEDGPGAGPGDADSAPDDGVELAVAAAAALALDGYVTCAQDCLQLLGGIGFTWEHDLHLHLKRALADRQLVGGGDVHRLRLAAAAVGGARRDAHGGPPRGGRSVAGGVRAPGRRARLGRGGRPAAAPGRPGTGRPALARAAGVGTRARSSRWWWTRSWPPPVCRARTWGSGRGCCRS